LNIDHPAILVACRPIQALPLPVGQLPQHLACQLTHADIVLLKNGPEALPYLLDLAARSRRITRQNLIWATVYNLTILPLAISGYLTPWIAALGMSTSSLLIIANALRIHRTPPPPATE